MNSHTVFVSNINDATAYYESVFGFTIGHKEENQPLEPRIYLSSKGATHSDIDLVLVEDEKAAYAQLLHKTIQAIEWKSTQFWEDYHAFSAFGVVFEALPKEQDHHKQVFFIDAYGVHWKLTC